MPDELIHTELNETQEAILEVAANNPDLTISEVADRVGVRIPLVRDTLPDYGETLPVTESTAETSQDEPNATQEAILAAAANDPAATNAELAAEVGVRVPLVRDTLAEHDVPSVLSGQPDTDNLSETQEAILEVAAANPDLSIGAIADRVGARIPLVRDTVPDADDRPETGSTADASRENELNATQETILAVAADYPNLTIRGIAERVGARIPLVRDTLEHADDVAGPFASETEVTVDDLSETQEAILEVAAANPELSIGAIADRVGARVPLVRDTVPDVDERPATGSTAETDSLRPELSETQEAILAVAAANPDLTIGEIATEVGARISLVRDTLATHDEVEPTADE